MAAKRRNRYAPADSLPDRLKRMEKELEIYIIRNEELKEKLHEYELLERERQAERDAQAIQISEKVKEEELKHFLGLTHDDIHMLDRLTAGEEVENSGQIMKALKLKLEHAVGKPSATQNARGGELTVTVNVLSNKGVEERVATIEESA